MISGVKRFGSYVRQEFDEESARPKRAANTSANELLSNCAIPSSYIELKLLSVSPYNHDCSFFEFSLPEGHTELRLPIGSHLLVHIPAVDERGDAVRPYTSVSCNSERRSFTLLIKRYDEWGKPESRENNHLYTSTDHSYHPPGRVSSHVHSMSVGASLRFKHNASCLGALEFPYKGIRSITMIAVGIGVAPMVTILKAFAELENWTTKIVLLYGVKRWPDKLRIVYCVGSRWNNVHMFAKTKNPVLPAVPADFASLEGAELGWVNEDKIRRHALAPSDDARVFVCGLPGIYDKLCGPRVDPSLAEDSVLHRLGYKDHMVVKF